MTKIPIGECPAGPALDAAVIRTLWSEKVDSLVVDFKHMLFASGEDRLQESLDSGGVGVDNIVMGEAESFCLKLPEFSTDIAAAWRLAEQLAIDYEFYIVNYKTERIRGWCANYRRYQQEWNSIDADTAPLAITRAYLKVRGVEFVEIPNDED